MLKNFYKFFISIFVFSLILVSFVFAQTNSYSHSTDSNEVPFTNGTGFAEKWCTSKNLVGQQKCIATAVSSYQDKITIGVYDPDPNQTLTVHENMWDPSNINKLLTSATNTDTFSSNTCNSVADTEKSACQLVYGVDWGEVGLHPKQFQTYDGIVAGLFSTYQIDISCATIGMTATVDGVAQQNWGFSLPYNKEVKITCTNSTHMTLDGASVGTNIGNNTIEYTTTNTSTTTETKTVVCKNVCSDTASTTKTFNFSGQTTGDINATNCLIPDGANSCSATINWTTTNPIGISQVTSPYPSAGTVVANANSNTGMSVTIPYSSRIFFLYNNEAKLDEVTSSANCLGTSSFRKGECIPNTCPEERWNTTTDKCMTGDIDALGCEIETGKGSCYSQVTWKVNDPVSNSKVTSNYPSTGFTVSTSHSGTESLEIPYSSRDFFLYNNGVELDKTTVYAKCKNTDHWSVKACCGSGTDWDSTQNKCAPLPIDSQLSATTCTIETNASTCSGTVSWSTKNTTNTVSIWQETSSIYTGISGESKPTTLPYGTTTLYLKHGGETLKTAIVNAKCKNTDFWNGSICIPNTCPPERWNPINNTCMSGEITALNCLVSYNQSSCEASVSWKTINPIGVSELTSSYPTSNTSIANTNNGSKFVTIPLTSRTFYLYNNGAELDVKTSKAACEAGLTIRDGKCLCPSATDFWDGSVCVPNTCPPERWNTVTKTCMSGSLTTPNCVISANASRCNVNISWKTTDPIGTSKVTSNYPVPNTEIATANSNTGYSVSIPYSSRDFFLYNNGAELARGTSYATCADKTSWDGEKCILSPVVSSLSATTCTIETNTSTCYGTVSWNTTNTTETVSVLQGSTSIYTGITGNSKSTTLPYGNTTFYLKHGGETLKTTTVNAKCKSTDFWNGSICIPNTCPPERWNSTTNTCMFGSLTSTACAIPLGASSCNTTLTWSTTDPIGVSAITSNKTDSGSVGNITLATGNNGTKTAVVPYSSRDFFLYNNGAELAKTTVNVDCVSGAVWSSIDKKCVSKVCPQNQVFNTTTFECECPVNFPIMDSTGYCHADCPPNSLWNETVKKCMTGTMTYAACEIPANADSCNISLTWNTVNPIGTSAVTSNTPAANTLIANGNSNIGFPVSVTYPSRNFYLYNSATLLASVEANVKCVAGTTWIGDRCASPTSNLNALDCIIADGANSCNTTLTWTVNNPIGNSAVTSNYPGANTIVGTGHLGTEIVSIPYSSRMFFLYNNGNEIGQVEVKASCGTNSVWDTKSKTCISKTCVENQIFNITTYKCECPPDLPIMDSTGYCHAPCINPGEEWDEMSRICSSICPPGQVWVSGDICMDINIPPVCEWLDPGVFNLVTCEPLYYPCIDGSQSVFTIVNSDNTRRTLPNITTFEGPNNFNWGAKQLRYEWICPNEVPRIHPALVRPRTQFIDFNVSAGRIKAGSAINLSWTVELPNSSCKIEGISIETGETLFSSDDYSVIKTKLNSPADQTTKFRRSNSYNDLMNKYLTINKSMRFTASCTDIELGYTQLVRDVYVIDEADR